MEPRFPKAAHDRAGTASDQERWDERYRSGKGPRLAEISRWVEAQAHHLAGGRCLDVACGPGRYSLWLARQGYEVDAVDASTVALEKLVEAAAQEGFGRAIHVIHADLAEWRPQPNTYDLVLVSLYLNRDLLAGLQQAVRGGGLLLYTSFHTDLLLTHNEFTPEYLLQPGELLAVFAGWELLAYEERRWRPGGTRDDCTSSILVRKPLAV